MFNRKFKKGDRVIVNDPIANLTNEPGTVVKIYWFGDNKYDVELDTFKDEVMVDLLEAFFGKQAVRFTANELTKVESNV